MFPIERLLELRSAQGSFFFSAEYQGTPTDEGSGIFKRGLFRWFTLSADGNYFKLQQPDGTTKLLSRANGHRIMTVDLATSEKTSADFTVLAICFVSQEGELLVEEIVRQRVEGPELPLIETTFLQWEPSTISIESVGFQLALVQMAIKRGLPVRKLEARGDKIGRAMALAAKAEAGQFYLRQGAPWLHDLEPELLNFPSGRHDDQVDVLAYAAMEAIRRGEGSWDQAYGVQRCDCGTAWSDMSHKVCPGCGKPPATSDQPALSVVDDGGEPQESWYPPPSPPDPLEQLAALRVWAGRRW